VLTPGGKNRKQQGLIRIKYRIGEGDYGLALITFEDKDRSSEKYRKELDGIVGDLNTLGYGGIRNILCDRLVDQTDNLILYLPMLEDEDIVRHKPAKTFGECSAKEKHLPLDIRYLDRVYSHIRNPTILVLRRVFSRLTVDNRNLVTQLVEMQIRQKKIEFSDIDFKREVDELERHVEGLARQARDEPLISRKLDILVSGIKCINAQKRDYVFLQSIVRDPFHTRRFAIQEWQEKRRVTHVDALNTLIDKANRRLDDLLEALLALMTEISGIQFAEQPDIHDTTFNWYTLGLEVPRAEYFSTSFSIQKKTEMELQRKSHFFIRSLYDATNFQKAFDRWEPSKGNYRAYVPENAALFLSLNLAISASLQSDGEVLESLKIDRETGITNQEEQEEAKTWVKENRKALLALEKRLADRLKQSLQAWPVLVLPDEVMALLEGDGPVSREMILHFRREQARLGELKDLLEDLEKETREASNIVQGQIDFDDVSEETDTDGADEQPLLTRLVALYREATESKDFWHIVDHQRLHSDEDAERATAEKNFNQVLDFESDKDALRSRCEALIVDVYEHVPYCVRFPELEAREDLVPADKVWVDRKTHRTAFEVALFQRIGDLRKLDYQPFDPARYRERFEAAKKMNQVDAMFMIDRIFHEIRCLPRADQLLEALRAWDKNLLPTVLKKYEERIIESNDQLTALLDEVRVHLRDQLQKTDKLWPRRLRMEVFGLGDFFSDNLRELFWSQEHMIARVATPSELGLLLNSLESIETQIFEAQKWTKDGGRTDQKLRKLRNAGLFSDEFLATLEEDLAYTKKDLRRLLEEISGRMHDIREIKKRFDTGSDDAYLELVIAHGDISRLQGIYEFLESLGPRHLKRFAWGYKEKKDLLDSLIRGEDDSEISMPTEIAAKITPKIRKAYFASDKRILDHMLRLEILDTVPEALAADCRQLAYTLNFVKFGKASKKASWQIPLAILEETKKLTINDVRRRMARRYWSRMRDYLEAYAPEAFFGNYENNMKAFFKDKETKIGDAL